MDKEKLNKNDVLLILHQELLALWDIQDLSDISDQENIKASHKEESIRFAISLIQRME
jgi:hypothetical protein